MTGRQKKWVLLILLGLAPMLGGCEGCDRKPGAPPAPFAPSNLSATVVSFTEIDLNWTDNSTNEKGFYIYRKSSVYQKIGSVGANTTSARNSNLTSGITYSYKVTVYNDGGESGFSDVATATTPVEVEILNYYMEEEYFGYDWLEYTTTIIGNVRNNTQETLTIWIAGKFVDQNDIVVEISYDLLEDVKSNETWRFEIVYWNEIGERIKRVEAWVDDYY